MMTEKQIMEIAREIETRVREEVPGALRAADGFVRRTAAQQPLLALGAALVAGYAMGRFLSRRVGA